MTEDGRRRQRASGDYGRQPGIVRDRRGWWGLQRAVWDGGRLLKIFNAEVMIYG